MNSRSRGRVSIPNMRIRNCLDCGAKQKWVFQDNQNYHNTKNYKSKTHSVKGIIRVEVCWALQYLYTQMKGAESDYWTINLSVQNKYWGTNKRKYFRDILSFCSLKYKKHKVFWKFWHGIPLILAVSAYMAETFAFHEKILQQWGNRLVNIVLQNLFIIFAVYFLYQSSANTQTYINQWRYGGNHFFVCTNEQIYRPSIRHNLMPLMSLSRLLHRQHWLVTMVLWTWALEN